MPTFTSVSPADIEADGGFKWMRGVPVGGYVQELYVKEVNDNGVKGFRLCIVRRDTCGIDVIVADVLMSLAYLYKYADRWHDSMLEEDAILSSPDYWEDCEQPCYCRACR